MENALNFHANKIASRINGDFRGHHEQLQLIRRDINEFENPEHKILIITKVLERAKILIDSISKKSLNWKDDNPQLIGYQTLSLHLTYDLNKLGVSLDGSPTLNEKIRMEEILTQIKEKLSNLELGNEIIFNEIQELRDYLFMKKRTWIQLFAGKIADWTASSLIGDNTANEIKELIKEISIKGIE